MTARAAAATVAGRVERLGGRGWTLTAVAVAAVVLLPVVALAAGALTPSVEVWRHLWATRLPGMLGSTVTLLAGVAVGTLAVGGGLAWLVSAYRFPGRRWLSWLLVLPLAMPAYVLGFVFLAVFGFTGPVQGALRALFGPDVWVPEIRSLGGAVAVLTLTLYPYVYILARVAFAEQAAASFDVARSLGHGPLRAARRVVLPLARPSLAAGLALVMMETLTDFATVVYFDVETVSVGVFRVWKGMYDREAAAELAALVLLFALAVLAAERLLRGRRRYEQSAGAAPRLEPVPLRGVRAWLATGVCTAVLGLALAAPLVQLVAWTAAEAADGLAAVEARYLGYLANSSLLAGLTAAVVASVAVLLTNAARFSGTRTSRTAAHLATAGYAVPGPVIAVGVLLVLAAVDRALDAVHLPAAGLVATGSLAGLVYAYAVRFLAPGVVSMDASLQKVPVELTLAARTLGARPGRVLRRVHLPLTQVGLAATLLLVLVEALKELPIVLLLRPFGFDTLAVWVWQLAAESRWQAAAMPALTIVAVSLVPLVILARRLGGEASDGGPR